MRDSHAFGSHAVFDAEKRLGFEKIEKLSYFDGIFKEPFGFQCSKSLMNTFVFCEIFTSKTQVMIRL